MTNNEGIKVKFTFPGVEVEAMYYGDMSLLGQFMSQLHGIIPQHLKSGAAAAKKNTVVERVRWIELGVEKGKNVLKLGAGEWSTFGINIYEDSINDVDGILPKLTEYKRYAGDNVSSLEAIIELRDDGKPKRVIEIRKSPVTF